eukprot:symbB.v1.2.011903.t1/scaffold811.1/size160404/2
MREDVDSLRIFQRLLEKERGLASRWRKQADYSAWMYPNFSHHESRFKPGDGVRMSVSRSHPSLNGVSGTVLRIDSPKPTKPTGPRPVIFSSDPGIDDSIALLLALASPELDVRAVCINFGSLFNTSHMAQNALSVLTLAGRSDIPVYLGATAPLSQAYHDLGGPLFHGKDGLGGVEPPPAAASVNTSRHAAEVIVEECRRHTRPLLISLAPLTNVALALNLEPKLPQLCPDLFLMGGTIMAPGNVGSLSEANIANDPEAAARVFAAGFNTHVAGLDVTMATWLPTRFLESLRSTGTAGSFIWNITRFYENAYHHIGGFEDGMPLHDPSAVMMFLHPQSYELKRWPVVVDTSPYPSVTRGLVLADRRGGPLSPSPPLNATVHFGMSVDATSIRESLFQRIASLAKGHPVKLTPADSKPKKLKVQPALLLQGRNTSGAFPQFGLESGLSDRERQLSAVSISRRPNTASKVMP